jgi:hypothetical protein
MSIAKFIKETITDKAIETLKRKGKKATGQLINSIRIIKEVSSNGFEISVVAERHWKFVDEGRRPGAKPPPITAISKWIRQKGINASPYAIAKSIGKKGISPTKFISKPIDRANRGLNAAIDKEIESNLLSESFSKLIRV